MVETTNQVELADLSKDCLEINGPIYDNNISNLLLLGYPKGKNMKPLFTIIALLFGLSSFAQYDWPPKGEENVDYYYNSKEKHDGLHYRTYGDGTLFYIGIFENGAPKPGSEFWYYYQEPSGTPMTLHTILSVSDSIHAVNYSTEGNVISVGNYYKQKKDGLWKFYSEEGILKSTETYLNDQKNGESKVYYDNGKVYRVETYSADVKDGPWLEYFDSGMKKTIGGYKDGKRQGSITYYYSNGRIDIEGEYEMGLKDGTWRKYNSDGQLELSTLYKMDQKVKDKRENGEFMDYYENGIPKSEYTYVHGQKDGPFKVWFNKGEWIREPVQMDDGGGLSYKEKLIGTQIQREGDYLDGKLEGEVTYYNERGQVEKIETYSEGELISTEEKN